MEGWRELKGWQTKQQRLPHRRLFFSSRHWSGGCPGCRWWSRSLRDCWRRWSLGATLCWELKGRKSDLVWFSSPYLWVLCRCTFVCVSLCVCMCVCLRIGHSPMVWPGVESGVTDPSGDGWNCCWTLVRIILAKWTTDGSINSRPEAWRFHSSLAALGPLNTLRRAH